MYDIYYAHHQWKYGTKEETYELDLIKRYFPNAVIFNPSVDLKCQASDGEKAIMKECFEVVRNSDILVFSSLNGVVGTGVYHEVKEARKVGKIIFYIYQDKLITSFDIHTRKETERTDRLYALVDPIID